MGRKLTLLAVALRAIEPLSDEEKQVVRDMLRPAPKLRSKSKPERNPSQKRKAGKEATATADGSYGLCRDCQTTFDNNVHHKQTMPGYHEFVEPASEASKGVGA